MFREISAKQPKAVAVLRGPFPADFVGGLHNPVLAYAGYSKESQEQDEEREHELADMAVQMFAITPKSQTNLGIVEMTAAAIQNPEQTAITFIDEDDGVEATPDQEAACAALRSLATTAGAKVFDGLDAAAEFINGIECME